MGNRPTDIPQECSAGRVDARIVIVLVKTQPGEQAHD
jgi:hypothetical protein